MILRHHMYMAPDDGTNGGGGGGGAPGPTDKPADKPADQPGDKAPDLAETVKALQAQLATLTQERDQEKQKAEEARKAGLTAEQRLAQDRQAFETQKAALVDRARSDHLTRAGVMPKAHALAPQVDPSTPEGQAALEKWVGENPEFKAQRAGEVPTFSPPPKSMLAKIISGEATHPLFSADHLRKILNKV